MHYDQDYSKVVRKKSQNGAMAPRVRHQHPSPSQASCEPMVKAVLGSAGWWGPSP